MATTPIAPFGNKATKDALRVLAERMRGILELKAIDGGYLNAENMATFVEGTLALLDENERLRDVADALAGDLIAEVGHNFSGEYPQPESLDRWRALNKETA